MSFIIAIVPAFHELSLEKWFSGIKLMSIQSSNNIVAPRLYAAFNAWKGVVCKDKVLFLVAFHSICSVGQIAYAPWTMQLSMVYSYAGSW